MRSQITAVLMIVVALVSAGMALPPPIPAQPSKSTLTIIKIRVPQLDLFDETGKKLGVIETSTLRLPLDALAKAPNGRLKIPLPDGRTVWIDGMYAEIKVTDVPPCDPGRKMVAGATRGSGERCR
jgi:hypothetical protein